MIIGIDASNIRAGGGLTHIIELLKTQNLYYFDKIILWSGNETLSTIDDKNWLEKKSHLLLDKNILFRFFWQIFYLKKVAIKNNCDILFIPGGTYLGSFSPFVTMSQNLLPFEFRELKKYGFSYIGLKMLLLRYTQTFTFKKASGVIFLTNYAETVVTKISGKLKNSTVISHGIPKRFKQSHSLVKNEIKEFKILYVSIIDVYKNQINVVKAINNLRKLGYSVTIDLIGPAYKPELNRLSKVISLLDPNNNFIKYIGQYPYNNLHEKYTTYDIFVYASTCENQPIILLEAMASGLPIACSNFGPMPEVLKDAGQYFNPEDVSSITIALKDYLDNFQLRQINSYKSLNLSSNYSWENCSQKTFEYLNKIIFDNDAYKKSHE